MKYLVGEIGFSLLIACLIGLLIGWLISHFLKSRSHLRSRTELEEGIRRREYEIKRLRSDLRFSETQGAMHGGQRKEYSAAQTHRSVSGSGGNSPAANTTGRMEKLRNADAKFKVASKDMRGDSASITVRTSELAKNNSNAAPRGVPQKQITETPRGNQPSAGDQVVASRQIRGQSTKGQSDSLKMKDYQVLLSQKNRQVEELQQKVRDLVAATASRKSGKSTVVQAVDSDRIRVLKAAAEDESYAKVQALASLGEAEAKLTLQKNAQVAPDTELQPLRRLNSQQESIIIDLRKRLDIQHQHTSEMRADFERKLRVSQTSRNTGDKITGAKNDRQLALKAMADDETYAKVQALAALGEAERKLASQHHDNAAVSSEIGPLRRRAEQQDAIITDLRKRVELVQNQTSVMRQEYERKLRGRDSDLTLMRAESSAQGDSGSRAEVESYQRKLLELERANQGRIKDFNSTLEARNREYDQLGLRLERLREQVAERDLQITELKDELEMRVQDKASSDVKDNKYREELGVLQISLKEKDAAIASLKSRETELQRTSGDVRDMEKQLEEFTRSTEQSARKLEGVILRQRETIKANEARIEQLQKSIADSEQTYGRKIAAAEEGVNRFSMLSEAQTLHANRYRDQVNSRTAEISNLGKELRNANVQREAGDQEILRLTRVAADVDKLQLAINEKELARQQLQRDLTKAGQAVADAKSQHKSVLDIKDKELNRITEQLSAARVDIERERSTLQKVRKEAELQQAQMARVTEQHESQSRKLEAKLAELEPLRLKLTESTAAVTRLQDENKLVSRKSSAELLELKNRLDSAGKSNDEKLKASAGEIAALNRNNTDLQKRLSASEEQHKGKVNELNAELVKLRKQNTDSGGQLTDLQRQLTDQKNELQTLRGKLAAEQKTLQSSVADRTAMETSLKDYKVRLEALKGESLAATERDKKSLLEAQKKAQDAAGQHKLELDKRSQEVAELRQKLQSLETVKENLAKRELELSGLNKNLTTTVKESDAQRAQIGELRKTADEARIAHAKEKEMLESELRKARESTAEVVRLRQQLTTSESDLTRIRKDFEGKESRFQALITELTPWQKRFQDAEQEVQTQKASIVKLKADSSSQLEQEIARVEQRNAELLKQREQRIAELDSKVKTLEALRTEISERDKKLAELNTALTDVRKQADVYQLQTSDAEKKYRSTEEKLTALQTEHSSASKRHSEVVQTHGRELGDLKAAQQAAIEKRKEELKQQESVLEGLNKQLASKDRQIKDTTAQLESARSDYNRSLADAKKWRQESESRQQQLTQVQSEQNKLKSRVQELEPLKGELATVRAEFTQKQQSLSASGDKYKAEINSLQARVKEMDTLKQQLGSREAEIGKLQAANKSATEKSASEIQGLRKELQELTPLRSRLSAKEAEYSKLQESMKAAGQKHQSDAEALQKKIAELEPLRSKLAARESEFAKLQSEQQASAQKSTAQLSELQAKVKTLEPLQSQLSEQRTKYQQLEQSRKAESDRHSTEVAKLNKRIEEIGSLQQKLSAQEKSFQALQNSQREAAARHEKESAQLKDKLREIEALQKRIAEQDSARKTQADQHASALSGLQGQIKSLEPLTGKLSAREAAFRELETASKNAQQKHTAEIATLRSTVSRLDPLEKKLATASAELQKLQEAQKQSRAQHSTELGELQAKVKSAQTQASDATANASRQITTLRAEADKQQSRLKDLEAQLSGKQSEIQGLLGKTSQLSSTQGKLASAEKSLQDRNREVDTLKKSIQSLEQKINDSRSQSEQQRKALADQLAEAKARLREYETLKREADARLAEVSQAKATITELNNKLSASSDAQRRLAELEKQLAAANKRHSGEVEIKDKDIEILKREIERLNRTARAAAAAPPPKAKAAEKPKEKRLTADGKNTRRKDGMDDLKLIFGIGPKIEKLLNKNGVTQFEDIANWKDADVQRYSDLLGSFPDRIERDEWVLSAQQILAGTYNWEERRSARKQSV